MTIAIPFFARKARAALTPRAADARTPQPAARAATLVLARRRFGILARPEPTVFQRCLATHMYFAARKSALD
jgi:hypothetical protein